jgi:hypothetical protein
MRLDFDMSDVDLTLSLYDQDGNLVQDINESTPERSYEEATLDLTPGARYYLWVWQPPQMGPTGTPYTIWCTPGEGTMNIIVQ